MKKEKSVAIDWLGQRQQACFACALGVDFSPVLGVELVRLQPGLGLT